MIVFVSNLWIKYKPLLCIVRLKTCTLHCTFWRTLCRDLVTTTCVAFIQVFVHFLLLFQQYICINRYVPLLHCAHQGNRRPQTPHTAGELPGSRRPPLLKRSPLGSHFRFPSTSKILTFYYKPLCQRFSYTSIPNVQIHFLNKKKYNWNITLSQLVIIFLVLFTYYRSTGFLIRLAHFYRDVYF